MSEQSRETAALEKEALNEKKKNEPVSHARLRDGTSGAMAAAFFLLFLLFAWYGVYQKSLDFLTGADTGIPGNPEVIPQKMIEPAVRAVVQAMAVMTLYAFVFANPDRALGHAGERLYRQDLRGQSLGRRAHFWTVPWWGQALLIFVFSYWLRTKVIALIGQDTIQIMDFERVFYISLEDAPVFADVQGINFYQAFPNWALHVKLLHLLNINFGGTPLTGITWNAVMASLSAALLYLVVYFATDKDVFAVISALIFTCWPFWLYYTILLTPDFNFVFLCLLGLLLIVISYRFVNAVWLKICFSAAAGVVLSLAGFFKSIDKILIIALGIAWLLSFIAYGRFDRKKAICGLLGVAVFFGAWMGTGRITYRLIEDYVGGPVNRDVSPYFLNVGMNVDTYGQWSEEVLDEYLSGIRETNYDFERVNAQMKANLEQRVEEVKDKMEADGKAAKDEAKAKTKAGTETEAGAELDSKPGSRWDFFDVKLQKAWANNEGIRFIMQTINPENPLYDMEFYETYYAQIQAYQTAVALLMILGGLCALLMRDRRIVMVSALMVFGFALLLLLSEVQPRYKAVVFPFMSVVAAYGIYGILRPLQLVILTGFRRIRKRAERTEAAHIGAARANSLSNSGSEDIIKE